MSFERIILLTTPGILPELLPVLRGLGREPEVVMDRGGLDERLSDLRPGRDLLLCANSGVLVPGVFLEALGGMAYNFHAAPPEFPGRDPHHFGVYHRARRFGATAHVMINRVDAGPIVGVECFDVADDGTVTAPELYSRARRAQVRLFARLVPAMLDSRSQLPPCGEIWGPHVFTRREFQELCRVDQDMDPEEFALRRRACEMPGYANLYTEIHGVRFSASVPKPAPGDDA